MQLPFTVCDQQYPFTDDNGNTMQRRSAETTSSHELHKFPETP